MFGGHSSAQTSFPLLIKEIHWYPLHTHTHTHRHRHIHTQAHTKCRKSLHDYWLDEANICEILFVHMCVCIVCVHVCVCVFVSVKGEFSRGKKIHICRRAFGERGRMLLWICSTNFFLRLVFQCVFEHVIVLVWKSTTWQGVGGWAMCMNLNAFQQSVDTCSTSCRPIVDDKQHRRVPLCIGFTLQFNSPPGFLATRAVESCLDVVCLCGLATVTLRLIVLPFRRLALGEADNDARVVSLNGFGNKMMSDDVIGWRRRRCSCMELRLVVGVRMDTHAWVCMCVYGPLRIRPAFEAPVPSVKRLWEIAWGFWMIVHNKHCRWRRSKSWVTFWTTHFFHLVSTEVLDCLCR